MRHRGRSVGLHEDLSCLRTIDAFLELRSLTEMHQRMEEIAALPRKAWKGHQVYELRCLGPYGKGPHTVYVPERVLWSLLSLNYFLCPYHR